MNKIVFFFFLVTLLSVFVQSKPAYETKFDDVDVDTILKSKRLVQGYINCVLGSGPCTPDGAYLASILPDAISTGCAECNDIQKAGAKKVFQTLESDYPEEFAPLKAKWDPSGEKLKAFLA